eukprot:403360547
MVEQLQQHQSPPQNYGVYKLEFKEDEILDDYRFANHKVLQFPDIVTLKNENNDETKQSLYVFQDFNQGKGGICWDASYVMAKVVERDIINAEKHIGQKLNFIELGAATALPSLLIAGYGHKILATDLKKVVNIITEKCLKLNPDIKGEIQAMELSWGNDEHLQMAIDKFEDRKLDYIICADLIYLDETFEDLVKTLKQLSSYNPAHTPIIFMSYKIRLPELTQQFIDMLKVEFDIIEELNILDIHPNPQEKFIKAMLKKSE